MIDYQTKSKLLRLKEDLERAKQTLKIEVELAAGEAELDAKVLNKCVTAWHKNSEDALRAGAQMTLDILDDDEFAGGLKKTAAIAERTKDLQH